METSGVNQAINFLASLPSFAGLDQPALNALAQAAILRSYAADEIVFLEGEPCAGLYIVQEGWLKSVKISTSGREQTIRFVGPGEAFNETAVFAGGNNLVTVETLEPAKIWMIPRKALLLLVDQHPSICHLIIQNLAQRAQYLMSLVEDLSLRPVESRLARLLLEQTAPGGDTVQRKPWSTQTEIAAQIGTVPDVLNRVLRNLVEAGLIRINRQQIEILDMEGLRARAMLGD
ncbi:MAG: Crp/Fnr family transcriptional regulator [Omnitrophica WOR_2 bacterium]